MKLYRQLNNIAEVLFLITGGIFLLGFLLWGIGFSTTLLGIGFSGAMILSVFETPLFLFSLLYLVTSMRISLLESQEAETGIPHDELDQTDRLLLVIVAVLFIAWLIMDITRLAPLPVLPG